MIPRWILLLVLGAPVLAAPKALTADQLKSADAESTSLLVNIADPDIQRLGRFKALTELRLTGPYDDDC